MCKLEMHARFILLMLLGVYSSALQAAPQLHVLFHMGAGANDQFFVGGTLENKGDEDVYRGFLVITPLTKDCYPEHPILSPFGAIKAGEKFEFKIPVRGRLHGYKLDTVQAVDSFANKVFVVDTTAAVMASKQPSYQARCLKSRKLD
ncbi:hypothetical protein [Aeromonas hydrophila]|uniref:hypothetical protein n=1 Tax=Aeromonas hydrophila TaxID=644 RepID=UPI003EC8381F